MILRIAATLTVSVLDVANKFQLINLRYLGCGQLLLVIMGSIPMQKVEQNSGIAGPVRKQWESILVNRQMMIMKITAGEILNIDYHIKELIVKALNRTTSHEKAAIALGISERNLFRLRKQYNIKKVQRYEVVELKISKK